MSKLKMLVVKDGAVLRPYGDHAWTVMDELAGRKPLVVTVHKARNPRHFGKFRLIAQRVADFHPGFIDDDDAIEWVKVRLRYVRSYRVTTYSGEPALHVQTQSLSEESMDQIRFNRFYKQALWAWAEEIGCDPESLLPPLPETGD